MSRAFRLIALAAAVILTGPALAQLDRPLAPDAALEDIRLARRAWETIHPGWDRYTSRDVLSARFDALQARAAAGLTERALFAELSRIAALVRCSHTKIEPSKAWSELRERVPTYLPFRVDARDGRMVVIDSADDAIAPGDQVLSLDGVAASEIVGTILAAVPADGWTDGARAHALGASSDLDECELDLFYPVFFGPGLREPGAAASADAAAGADDQRNQPRTVAIELRRPGEVASRFVFVPLLTRDVRRAKLRTPPAPQNLDEAVGLAIVDGPGGPVGILRVGTFVAYRKPIAPADIYRPLFERLAQAKVSTLILDLRDNGGGSDQAAIDLARFLIDRPFEIDTKAWVRTYRFGDLAAKLETWDQSALNMPDDAFVKLDNGYFERRREPMRVEPLTPAFTGRLIALCGPSNASGATLFLAGLRARRPVTLVGEPTGGSVEGPTAGVIFFLPLPNSGLRVRIPGIRSVTGLDGAEPGMGIVPDALVATTAEDRVAGRDPALDRAMELARAPVQPR